MKRRLAGKRIWILLLAVLLLIALVAVALYRSARHVPGFYAQVAAPPSTAEREQSRREFERQVLEVHNSVRRRGAWEAVFTDQQLNTWLESDLPREFPEALAPPLSDPRLRFSPDRLDLGCRYRDGWLDVVLSVTAGIYLTERPNEIAIRIRSLRAGHLPLPQQRVLDQISQVARRNGLRLTWAQQDGQPVALLRVPETIEADGNRRLQLESIQLEEGALRVTGQMQAAPDEPGL